MGSMSKVEEEAMVFVIWKSMVSAMGFFDFRPFCLLGPFIYKKTNRRLMRLRAEERRFGEYPEKVMFDEINEWRRGRRLDD